LKSFTEGRKLEIGSSRSIKTFDDAGNALEVAAIRATGEKNMLNRRRRQWELAAKMLTGMSVLGVLCVVAISRSGSLNAAPAAPPPWARTAAKYLDERTAWWLSWPSAARGQETSCVACHTGLPFALARPALGKVLGENAPKLSEKTTIERVRKRVANWDKITAGMGMKPFYSGGRKPSALATEAVLNALILVNYDNRWNAGAMSEDTTKALDHLWACQKEDGAWLWLNFGLKPWETGEEYYGATLAAVAVGTSEPAYNQENKTKERLQKLRQYLKRHYAAQPLFNRMTALWASSAMEDLLNAEDKKKLIEEIFAAQTEDGGWNLPSLGPKEQGNNAWKHAAEYPKGVKSDGYATGLAVYVLKRAGVAKDDPKLRQGVKWLLGNQDKTEGTWPTIYLNRAHDPLTNEGKFMRDAAAAFAALALTEAE
jgi:squalene-hopene/tetraprenyl-beta-curcumene cyclase